MATPLDLTVAQFRRPTEQLLYDAAPPLQAYRQGMADQNVQQENFLKKQIGGTLAGQGYLPAADVAAAGGDVGTAVDLQKIPVERLKQMNDVMGRAAEAVPDGDQQSWNKVISTFEPIFGKQAMDPYRDVKSKNQWIKESTQLGTVGGSTPGATQEAIISSKGTYKPIGPEKTPLSPHHFTYNPLTGGIFDTETGKPAPGQEGQPAGAASAGADAGPKDIADAIVSGKQPPTTQGLYRQGPMVRAQLARDGFDLGKAQLEWAAAQKQVAALNSSQMVRYIGLTDSVLKTIDEVDSLAKEMDLGNIPAKNNIELQAYIQAAGNTPSGQLATRYLGAVNVLKEEFANLAQGGYAPTEPVWVLANQQINGTYGREQLGSSLTEVKRLLNYRKQAIPQIGTLGPQAPNRYGGQGAAPAAATDPSKMTDDELLKGLNGP